MRDSAREVWIIVFARGRITQRPLRRVSRPSAKTDYTVASALQELVRPRHRRRGAVRAVMGIGTLRAIIATTGIAVLPVAACGALTSTPPPIVAPSPIPTPSTSPTGIPVPASIDATGGSDASAALNTWLTTVPDGSTIVFRAGAVYGMDKGLTLESRHSLTFEGNGATMRSNGVSTCGRECSLFYLSSGNTAITIRNFTLAGNSPTPGIFDGNWEHASAITIVAGRDVEIANITVSGVGGDALTLSGVAPDWPAGIWFHDSHVISSGRMGVAVVAGRNVTVERVIFDTVGYHVFDIEPNDETQGASNVKFLNNTVGSWTYPMGFLFAADGAAGSAVEDVTVSGNIVTGGTLRADVTVARRRDIVFTNNASTVAVAGPMLTLAHVDGLTVTGNVQPLTTGVLASIIDCTGVTTQ